MFEILEQKEAKDRIAASHYLIPPFLVHDLQEWASIVVVLSCLHRSEDVVILCFVIHDVQISADPCSCHPFFKTNIGLKVVYSNI